MNWERTSTEGQLAGVVGIVFGIISLIVAFIPCIGIIALFPGLLAIVFSITSIVQASRGNGSRGLGIAALLVSLLSILIAVIWLVIIGGGSILLSRALKDISWFNQSVEYKYQVQTDTVTIDTLTSYQVQTQGVLEPGAGADEPAGQ